MNGQLANCYKHKLCISIVLEHTRDRVVQVSQNTLHRQVLLEKNRIPDWLHEAPRFGLTSVSPWLNFVDSTSLPFGQSQDTAVHNWNKKRVSHLSSRRRVVGRVFADFMLGKILCFSPRLPCSFPLNGGSLQVVCPSLRSIYM